MRSSLDSAIAVRGIAIGSTIKYRAGYKIWESSNGVTVKSGVMPTFGEYRIIDSAASVVAGLGTSIIMTLLF